jgi:ankyrin repeat protein
MRHDATPLMEAASGGYVDIVKLLKSHGAEVNAQTEAGNTALTYAACGGYEDVVEVLVSDYQLSALKFTLFDVFYFMFSSVHLY